MILLEDILLQWPAGPELWIKKVKCWYFIFYVNISLPSPRSHLWSWSRHGLFVPGLMKAYIAESQTVSTWPLTSKRPLHCCHIHQSLWSDLHPLYHNQHCSLMWLIRNAILRRHFNYFFTIWAYSVEYARSKLRELDDSDTISVVVEEAVPPSRRTLVSPSPGKVQQRWPCLLCFSVREEREEVSVTVILSQDCCEKEPPQIRLEQPEWTNLGFGRSWTGQVFPVVGL